MWLLVAVWRQKLFKRTPMVTDITHLKFDQDDCLTNVMKNWNHWRSFLWQWNRMIIDLLKFMSKSNGTKSEKVTLNRIVKKKKNLNALAVWFSWWSKSTIDIEFDWMTWNISIICIDLIWQTQRLWWREKTFPPPGELTFSMSTRQVLIKLCASSHLTTYICERCLTK